MFSLIKKVVILVLMSCALENVVKGISGNLLKFHQVVF